MRVSVIGIGYVGVVTSACMVKSGHDVVAVDVDPVKVKCLQEGRTPIIEPELAELIAEGVKSEKLKGTLDVRDAVMNTDITLICVGTPSRADGSLDLAYVESSLREIGEVIKDKDTFHTVVLRSTVVPGTAMGMALPLLEEVSGKIVGEEFGFGNNPEFLREGTAVYDYFNPPKIVIGAVNDKTADMMSALYSNIEAPEVKTSVEVSEGVKYADNAWHAMKIGFANEIGNILKESGVDSHKVMDIFSLDTKLNISKAYLKPGFAFGGSCLPKDVRAISASGKDRNVETPLFDALLVANDIQVERAFSMIEQTTGCKTVGMLGLSFKAGTDDLRESPLVTLADKLINAGYELSIYDPCVYEASKMEGANSKYINEGISHISKYLVENPDDMLKASDMFVIGNPSKEFPAVMEKADPSKPIIDLVRLDDELEQRDSYTGICW